MEEKKYFCQDKMNPKKADKLETLFLIQSNIMSNKTVKRVIVGSIDGMKITQGKLELKFDKSNYFEEFKME